MKTAPPQLGAGLDRLFAPRSIALVGASDREGSFGQRTQRNLSRFDGDLHLVNPKRDEIGGRPCFRSLDALPSAPDCVIVATPRESVEGLVEACVDIGAGGALVYASGFAEVGREELTALQARLVDKARAGGVRLVGPNAIGFINFARRAGATFMTHLNLDLGYDATPTRRRIGIVSQSGALGLALTQAMMTGQFFSHVLTCGNSSDVDVADCVAYLARDPSCDVIACNFEGMADPKRMRDAALTASEAGKPFLVYKMATGASGAAAAASHTGSLAGAHDAYRSMFDLAGAVLVEEYEALLETARFFAVAKAPPRPGVGEGMAVVATSGGAAIMAADAAEKHGVPLPPPSPELKKRLEARIPEFGAAENPCDVTAQVLNDMTSLTDCVEGFLESDAYSALAIPHLFAYELSLPRIGVVDALAEKHGKAICSVWLSSWLEGPGARETIAAPNTVLFRSTDRCFAAFAAWRRWLARGDAAVREIGRTAPVDAKSLAAPHLRGGGPVLSEREAKRVLAAYGAPVVGEEAATSAEAAVAAAERLGYPVAMKLDAEGLAHKTELGGVALGLADAAAARAAYDDMTSRAAAAMPPGAVRGALVQKMAAKGLEVVVGGRVDPVFGPLVVVGLGGVFVELVKDAVVAPAPVSPPQAKRLLERLRYVDALDGFRGLPPVDRDRLAEIVARISEFIADHRAEIAEVDVNPLICRGDEIVAVDALIVRPPTEGGSSPQPAEHVQSTSA